MGPPSALVGDPPLNTRDLDIIKGLDNLLLAAAKFEQPGQPLPSIPPPEKGFPFGLPRPPPSEYRLETRRPQFIAAGSVTIIVMILATGLRVAIRAQNAKLFFGRDDFAVILGTALALVVPATLLAQVSYGGLGKHIYDCTYHELHMSHILGATQLLFLFEALGVVKMSVVLLYMRVSAFTSRKWMIVHRTLLVVIILYCFAAFFVQVYVCQPAGAYWNLIRLGRMGRPPTCIDQSIALAVLSAVHVVTDYSLLIIPITLLWKVQMKWTRKLRIWLAGIFGLSSCTFALLRTVVQYRDRNLDPTYATANMISYVLLDLTTGVVAASLPVLSVLVTRIQHKYHEYRSSDRKRGDIPLRVESKPTPRRTPHRTSMVGITRLESCSGSD